MSKIARRTIVANFEDDYNKVLELIEVSEIDVIVYLVTHVSNEECFNIELERLFYLYKNFFEKIHKNTRLRIITEGADVVTKEDCFIYPVQRAIVGLAKAMACEKMNLDVKCIDIVGEYTKEVIEQVINEKDDFFTAIRNCKHYVNILVEEKEIIENKNISIRDHGVYVIAGGLGGFGLDIAQYLSGYQNVTVVLLGRREFNSGAIRNDIKEKIRKIQEKGTTIEYISADVNDQQKMLETVEEIYKKYGAIHGVFHCAGIGSGMKGEFLRDDDFEIFKSVLAPKIHGTYVLFNALKGRNIDFMVLMTSPITLTGGVQSGSYITANSFMDAFGKQNNSNMYIGAISWAPRMETVLEAEAEYDYGRQLFLPLSQEEIFYCLDTFLKNPMPYCVVGKINDRSELLEVSENLMFSIEKNIPEKMGNRDDKNRVNSISIDRKVELEGRKNHMYSPMERIIGDAYGAVFGYEKIGISDSFFEIGGDSIIAMKLVNYLNEKERIGLELNEFVAFPSVEMLAEYLETKQSRKVQDEVIKRIEQRKSYRATEVQKETYISCIANGETLSYNMPIVFQLSGEFCAEKFNEALIKLCQKHELMRASFFICDEELYYQVNDIDIDFTYVDQKNIDVKDYMKTFVKPFDLGKAPLWKIDVIKEKRGKYYLFFDMHHIIADDRTIEILIRDLFLAYQGKEMENSQYQFCDFAKWFEDNLLSEHMERQKKYWIEVLGEKIAPLNLPIAFSRKENRGYHGAVKEVILGTTLSKTLRSYSKTKGMSVFGIMISAFSVVLSKYSKQSDIMIGVPVSLRTRVEFDDIFGPLLNTVVLRAKPYNYLTINTFLDKMKNNINVLYSNREYPIHSLMNELGEQRELGHNAFYDVLFDYHGKSQKTVTVSDDMYLESISYSGEVSKLDMTMNVSEVDDIFKIWVEYSTDLFKEKWIQEFMDNYMMILEVFSAGEDLMLEDLKITQEYGMSRETEIFEELNDEASFDF